MKPSRGALVLTTFLLMATGIQGIVQSPEAWAGESEMTRMMGPSTLWQTPADCGEMSVWDISMGMCMPLPMADMPMKMAMLHGNIFGTRIWQTGPRGRSAYASTQMVMGDLGVTLGDHHYLNFDVMLTAERWSVPYGGYPLLLQIGEHNREGVAFIDAQHPHSSPLMGLTISDTISLGRGKDHVKIFFAPRGEATDGPVAFMHRPTGMINPDAPLGHHIGQDVGHISSTVLGASTKWDEHRFEASVYHGEEPSPDEIDLPIGMPDSISLRYVREFSPAWIGMASFARINAPESDHSEVLFENRYSASLFTTLGIARDWIFHNSLISGVVTRQGQSSALVSGVEEFLLRGTYVRIWGRLEILQRTATELSIPGPQTGYGTQWVSAATLGYTHKIATRGGFELALGVSASQNFLPAAFADAYGGNPWTGKIILQIGGMEMSEF